MDFRKLDYVTGLLALLAFMLLIAEGSAPGRDWPRLFEWANASIMAVFAVDAFLRLAIAADRRTHLRRRWTDAILLPPLAYYLAPGLYPPDLFAALRLGAIVFMMLTRLRHTRQLTALTSSSPAQSMICSFVTIIGVGTVLLMLPSANADGESLPLVDALFTSTSAVCVTGLIVRDTATQFTRLGQTVIMLLIQAGGLGIMTFSAGLIVFTGRRIDLRRQAEMQDALHFNLPGGIRRLIRFILLMTFSIQAAGFIFLFCAWLPAYDSAATAAGHAAFHAVSAFCNAGFSTFSDSLAAFQDNWLVNFTFMALIVTGGLGFVVMLDLKTSRQRRGRRGTLNLKLQTRAVLVMTFCLLISGTLLFAALDWRSSLGELPPAERWLTAAFLSVTSRTAGFNTVDTAGWSPASRCVTMALMFIGASPGSTGGGVKTTTAVVLLATVWCMLRRRQHVEIKRRTIPVNVIFKALSVFCLSLLAVTAFCVALLHTEQQAFSDVLFETLSAFGTVGLSTGITSQLTVAGRLLVTVLMFIGRLGPLTMAYAFTLHKKPGLYEYSKEGMMVG